MRPFGYFQGKEKKIFEVKKSIFTGVRRGTVALRNGKRNHIERTDVVNRREDGNYLNKIAMQDIGEWLMGCLAGLYIIQHIVRVKQVYRRLD